MIEVELMIGVTLISALVFTITIQTGIGTDRERTDRVNNRAVEYLFLDAPPHYQDMPPVPDPLKIIRIGSGILFVFSLLWWAVYIYSFLKGLV